MPSLGDAYAAAHLETDGMERDVDQITAQLRQVAEQWERILNVSGRVSADTKEADSEIKAMAREWEATLRDIRANVTVNVDLGDSVAKLESVQSLVEGLDGRVVSVKVELDDGGAQADLAAISAQAEALDGTSISIRANVELVDNGIAAQLEAQAAEWQRVADTITVRPGFDATPVTADLEAATVAWDQMADQVTVNPGFDPERTIAAIEAVKPALEQLLHLDATVNVDGLGEASSELSALEGELSAVGATSTNITVATEVRQAVEELLAVAETARAVGTIDPKITVDADTAKAEAEIRTLTAARPPPIDIGVHLDQAQYATTLAQMSELKALVEAICVDCTINIDVDTNSINAGLAQIQATLGETLGSAPIGDLGDGFDNVGRSALEASGDVEMLGESTENAGRKAGRSENIFTRFWARLRRSSRDGIGDIDASLGDLGRTVDNIDLAETLSVPDGTVRDLAEVGGVFDTIRRDVAQTGDDMVRLAREAGAAREALTDLNEADKERRNRTDGIGDFTKSIFGDPDFEALTGGGRRRATRPASEVQQTSSAVLTGGTVFDTEMSKFLKNLEKSKRGLNEILRQKGVRVAGNPELLDDLKTIQNELKKVRAPQKIQVEVGDAIKELERLNRFSAKLSREDAKARRLAEREARLPRTGVGREKQAASDRRLAAREQGGGFFDELAAIWKKQRDQQPVAAPIVPDILDAMPPPVQEVVPRTVETRATLDTSSALLKARALGGELETLLGTIATDVKLNEAAAIGDVTAMKAALERIAGNLNIPINIDEATATVEMTKVRYVLDRILGGEFDATVKVHTAAALLEAAGFKAEAERLLGDINSDLDARGRGQGGFLDFSKLFNADEWKRGFERIRNDFRSIFKGGTAKVDLDTTGALARARLLGGEIDALLGAISVDVELNAAAALGDAEAIQAALERIAGTIGIDIDLNSAAAVADMTVISGLLESIAGTVGVDVDLQTKAALLHAFGFKAEAERILGTISVDVDLNTKGAIANAVVTRGILGRILGGAGSGGGGQGGFSSISALVGLLTVGLIPLLIRIGPMIGGLVGGLGRALGSVGRTMSSFLGNVGDTLSLVFENISQGFKFVSQGLSNAFKTIGDSLQNFLGEGASSIASFGAKAVLIAAVIQLVIGAIAELVIIIVPLITGLIGLAAGFVAVAGALSAAAAATGVLGVVLNKDLMSELKQGFETLKNGVGSILRPVGEQMLQQFVLPAMDALTQLALAAAPLAGIFAGPIGNAIIRTIETIAATLSSDTAASFLSGFGQGIASLLDTLNQFLPQFLPVLDRLNAPAFEGWNALLRIVLALGVAFEPVAKAFFEMFTAAEGPLVEFGSMIIRIFAVALDGFNKFIGSKAFEAIIQQGTILFGIIIEGIGWVVSVMTMVEEQFGGISKSLGFLNVLIRGFFAALAVGVGATLAVWALVASAIKGVIVLAQQAINFMAQIIRGLLLVFQQAASGIGLLLSSVINGIASGLDALPDVLVPDSWISGLRDAQKSVDDFRGGVDRGFAGAMASVQNFADGIDGGIGRAMGALGGDTADFANTLSGLTMGVGETALGIGGLVSVTDQLGLSMENTAAAGTRFAQSLADQAALVGAVTNKFQQTIGLIGKMRETASKPLKIKTDFSVLEHDIGKLVEFNDAASTAASTATAGRSAVPGTPFQPPIESQANFVARKKAGQLDDRSGEKGVAGTAAAGLANDIQQSTTKTLVRGFTQAIAEADKQADEIVRRATYVTQLRAHGLYDLAEEVGKLEGEALRNAMAEIGDAAGQHAAELERRIDEMTSKIANSDANPLFQGVAKLGDDTLVQIKQLNFTKELEEQGKSNVAAWLAGLEGDEAAGAVKMIEAMTGGTKNAILAGAEKKLSDLRTLLEAVAFEQDPIGNMWFALSKTPGAKLGPEGWAALGVDNFDLQIAAGWTQALTNPFANKKPGQGVQGGTDTPHPMFDQATAGLTQKGKPLSQILKEGGVSESFTFTDTWGNVWRYVPPPGDASKPGKFVLVTVAEVSAPRENTATNFKSQMIDQVIQWAEQGLAGNQGAEQQKWAKLLTDPAAKAVNAAEREIAALAIARRQGRNSGSENFQMGFDAAKDVGDGAKAGLASTGAAEVATEAATTIGNAYTDGIAKAANANAAQLNAAGEQIATQVAMGLSSFNFLEIYTVANVMVFNFMTGIHMAAVQIGPMLEEGGARVGRSVVTGISQGFTEASDEQMAVTVGTLVARITDLLSTTTSFVAPTLFVVGRNMVMPIVEGMTDVSNKEAQNAGAAFVLNAIAGVSSVVDLGKSELGRIGIILATGFGEGVKWGIETGTQPAVGSISAFIATLGDTATSLGEAQKETLGAVGRSMATAVLDGIRAVSGKEAVATAKTFMDQVKAGFTGTATIAPTSPESRQQGARGGFFAGTEKAANAAAEQAAKSTQVSGPGVGIGSAVVDGIIVGMIARTPDIEKAAVGIANRIAQIMRTSLGIKSPSKVTTKIGQQVGEGFAIGLHSTADAAERAATAVAERAAKAMRRSAGNHMDLNAIWRGEDITGAPSGGGASRRRASGGSSKSSGPSQADLIKFYGAIASRHDELVSNLSKVGITYDQIRNNQGQLPKAAAEIAMQVFQLEQAMGKMPPALQGAVEAARTKLDTTKGIVRDVSVTPTGERISDQNLTQFFSAVFDRRNALLGELGAQGVTRDMVVNNTGTLTTQQGQLGMQVLQLEQAMASIPAWIRDLLAQQGRVIDPAGRFVDSPAANAAVIQQPAAPATPTGSNTFSDAKPGGVTTKQADQPLINIEKVEVVAPSPEKVPGQLFDKVGTEAWRLGWN